MPPAPIPVVRAGWKDPVLSCFAQTTRDWLQPKYHGAIIAAMTDTGQLGTLIVIGGGEDRSPRGSREILREVARRVRGGKLVLATVASHRPEGYFEEYQRAFADLGIGELVELYVEERSRAA